MRLVRFRQHRRLALGALTSTGEVVDLEAAAAACLADDGDPFADAEAALRVPGDAAAFLAGGAPAQQLADRAVAYATGRGRNGGCFGEPLLHEQKSLKLRRPLDPPLIVSTGVTFRDTLDASGKERPQNREFYLRNPSQTLGPDDPVPYQPWVVRQLDATPCLGVVVGKAARCLEPDAALDAVYGYCAVLDFAAQDLHTLSWAGPLFHMQYAQGKGFDGALAIGPQIVPRQALPAPERATARVSVDGRRVREEPLGVTVEQIAGMVAYLSQFVTLQPGMLLVFGSSDRTVVGAEPGASHYLSVRHPAPAAGTWLRDGMRIESEIDELGTNRHDIVLAEEATFTGITPP